MFISSLIYRSNPSIPARAGRREFARVRMHAARCVRVSALLACVLAAVGATRAPAASATTAPQLFWASSNANAIGMTDFNLNEFLVYTNGPGQRVVADSQHLYWANNSSIGRSNLDGSGVSQDFIPNLDLPQGIAVDQQYVYWANGRGGIGRANLDGSGVNPAFIPSANSWAVAVDSQYIYYSDGASIRRANLDGTGVTTLVSGVFAFSLAVDQRHIYWTTATGDSLGTSIGRADLDGTNVDSNFLTGADTIDSVASDGTNVFFGSYNTRTGHRAIGQMNADGIREVDQSFIIPADVPYGIAIEGRRIYWGNSTNGTIATTTFSQAFLPADGPLGLALDGQHVYWTTTTNTIEEANRLGNSAPKTLVDGGTPIGVAVDARHIYWTDLKANTISEANLDGSSQKTLVTGAAQPQGIAVDAQHVYWANYATNTIGRANLDGTGADESFVENASGPEGVAVDQQRVYWVNRGSDAIGEANLDGTSPNQAFIGGTGDLINGPNNPYGLAVDDHYIYWSSLAHGTIGRANIDGSGVNESFITAAAFPTGVAVYAAGPRDATPPLISVSHKADGQNGWSLSSPVTETVSASDGESGLAGAPSCSVDGNGATLTDNGAGSWTLPVSGEGAHAVSCSVSDNAGNQTSSSDTVNVDTEAPSIKVSHVADGQGGWNVTSSATERVAASDGGSGLAGAPRCSVDGNGATLTDNGDGSWTFAVSGEGAHAISCSMSDSAGNESSAGDAPKLDTRAPLVSYAGNAGTYNVADVVNITCSSSDPTPGSGVAGDTCQNATGAAYTFKLGSNTYAATATDNAGNVGKGSTSFTVTVDTDSLATLTQRFVTNSGIASSLCSKLASAKASMARGDVNAKNGQVSAYRNQLAAQTGKSITADQAALLARLAGAI